MTNNIQSYSRRAAVGYASPIGRLVISADAQGICDLRLVGEDAPRRACEDALRLNEDAARQASEDALRLNEDAPRVNECGLSAVAKDTAGEACGALCMAIRWLDAYFGREPLPAMPPLHLMGTPFQLAVWERLREIPFGATVTYGQLARMVGRPTAVRAVAQAVGRNPVTILVPCHRVVAAHGLGGYAYGLAVKEQLLTLEARRAAKPAVRRPAKLL